MCVDEESASAPRGAGPRGEKKRKRILTRSGSQRPSQGEGGAGASELAASSRTIISLSRRRPFSDGRSRAGLNDHHDDDCGRGRGSGTGRPFFSRSGGRQGQRRPSQALPELALVIQWRACDGGCAGPQPRCSSAGEPLEGRNAARPDCGRQAQHIATGTRSASHTHHILFRRTAGRMFPDALGAARLAHASWRRASVHACC